jgi:mono/diheme cytochrome c family protein
MELTMNEFRTFTVGLCTAILIQVLPVQAGTPVPYGEESVALGAQLYRQHCTQCHGEDGRAQVDVISDATDLTWPEDYYSGNTAGDIFKSIREGAGVAMPAFGEQIGDEEIWHLVNFIRSLWTEEQRETFQE